MRFARQRVKKADRFNYPRTVPARLLVFSTDDRNASLNVLRALVSPRVPPTPSVVYRCEAAYFRFWPLPLRWVRVLIQIVALQMGFDLVDHHADRTNGGPQLRF